MKSLIFLLPFFLLLQACSPKKDMQFERLSASRTKIHFENRLELEEDLDVFRYRNYYNGGGVAIGDINNDNLPDIFLTANMQPNRLFLNLGNFRFRDITDQAKIGGTKEWSTGVAMADVDGDGLLDIYVCNSGDRLGGKRENELFINNGNLTFTEKAKEYGLDDKGFSTHAAFFDYDQDGDLDCYILNNSFRPVSSLGYENIRHVRDSTGGDKLLNNNNGRFEDVSEKAGIYGSVIGFGLGVTVTDIDQDGWLDIYVSNDFFERDYLYINRRDGTFSEELCERIGHASSFSMGTDAADINNDGHPDIYVTDMLPDDEKRMKTMVHHESYDVHQIKLANGYYEQYMRNTLQLNRGDGTFAEIGQYAGVHATDWSWGTVIADFNNDLHKEIFVTNGIYKDLIDQDFIQYLANEENMVAAMRAQTVDFKELVRRMPSNKISNFMFQRSDGLKFRNVASEWGLDEPSFSNGVAYGDLDNDGDLDLVVNNVNQEVFIYRNRAEGMNKNYLKFSFQGPSGNTFGIGATIRIFTGGHTLLWENIPTRGFQSSMDYSPVIGLDTLSKVDSLIIDWGYHKQQKLYNVSANRHLTLSYKNGFIVESKPAKIGEPLFRECPAVFIPAYKHQENHYVDFNNERLLYHQLSREGPAMDVADLNGDGLDDVFLGGATGQAGSVYIQNRRGEFLKIPVPDLEEDKRCEDVDALFFDADGNGYLDLYVVSGGYSFEENSREYRDRLYLYTGMKGNQPIFSRSPDALPINYTMKSVVRGADFEGDGDIDLFLGGRAIPGKYGVPPSSALLLNDGKGNFSDATNRLAAEFNGLGMVTDAVWADIDRDDDMDLAVVGEWMPIVIFKNNGINLERLNNVPGLTQSEGWWRSICATDLNKDGNMDFMACNFGLNTRYKASRENPMILFVNDFDGNGTWENIYAYRRNNELYPVALRHDLIGQMPGLKKKYVHYKDFAGQTVQQIFRSEILEKSYQEKLHQLASVAVYNNGDGSYSTEILPEAVQYSPVFAVSTADFDGDGNMEIFLGGNFSATKPEEGRYDANMGLALKYIDKQWKVLNNRESGLRIQGDIRKAAIANSIENKRLLLVARNNMELAVYEF